MSLVLNTNNQGGGGFLVSNSGLAASPDLENSIIITPLSSLELSGGSDPSTNGEVLSVNGTPINGRCGTIVAPDYYTAETSSNDFLFGYSGSSATSCEYRVGLDYQFAGGEIIGKNIFAGLYGFYYKSSASGGRTTGNQFNINVKLLHSDGTMTLIGGLERTFSFTGSGTNPSVTISEKDKIKGITTAGFVASAGDRVVVDYKYTCTSVSTTQYLLGYGAILGKKFTRDDTTRLFPVQISIE